MNKKIVAGTGLDGLVASRLVELFDAQYNFKNASLKTRVNVLNKKQLADFVTKTKPAFFIHAAAFTDVNAAYNERGDKKGNCYLVNVTGTKNVANICAEQNIPLIHISTDYVFDGTKKSPYIETDPTKPLEWYGKTKELAEKEILKNGLPAMILRIAFPYRASYQAKPDLLAKIKQAIIEKRLCPQFSDTKITPTFIDDIAQAINLSLTDFQPGIYHTTGSDYLSNYEIATSIAAKFSLTDFAIKKGSLVDYSKTSERPFHKFLQISNAKFSQQYKFTFKTFNEGLTEITKQLLWKVLLPPVAKELVYTR